MDITDVIYGCMWAWNHWGPVAANWFYVGGIREMGLVALSPMR